MSERKPRKHYTAQEKIAILRRHLIEKVPVSDLCEQHGIAPTLFYRWQTELFENGAAALERKNGHSPQAAKLAAAERRVAALETKLVQKNEVLGELMEEYVAVKKTLGVG